MFDIDAFFSAITEAEKAYETMEPMVEPDEEKNYEWGMCYSEDLR